jgi:DNA repair exonuclease SbcCD ATPase subunit
MVMLGDIHRHQILQYYDEYEREPLVAYAGSMIQQNHGEKLEGHGWIEWDIPSRRLTHHELTNTYGYATLIVENGKVPDISHIPKNARLRVFVKDLEASKVKKIESILRKKFNLQEFIVNKMRDDQLTLDNQQHAAIFIDVQDTETQNKLIEDYLTRHYAVVDDDLMDRIHALNGELNGRVEAADLSRNIRWKPLRFEFSNMFSYGEGNTIELENMVGVHGLFSPNASGKTAAFDALVFCLYDKTPRAYKASHIMNNRKNKFECYLKFEVNGVEYGIRRIGRRKKNRDVKVNVEFWKVENGQKVLLNGDDRRSTNAIIRRYVGAYDDFILTSLSVQNNNSLFIDKSQSERKDLLSQFMGINIFDTLYQLALDEMKESRGALKRIAREDFAGTLATTQKDIEVLSGEYETVEARIDATEVELLDVECQVAQLYEKKIPLDVNDLDIAKLETSKEELAATLGALARRTLDLGKKKDELTVRSGSLAKSVTGYTDADIDTRYNELTNWSQELTVVTGEFTILKKQVVSQQKQLDHITTHVFDPNCDFCVKNNQTLASTERTVRKELIAYKRRVSELKPRKEDLEDSLEGYDGVVEDYNHANEIRLGLRDVVLKLLSLAAKLSELKNNITLKKGRLKEVNAKIKMYHKLAAAIAKNAEIDEQISAVEQKQNELSDSLRGQETKLRGLHGKLQVQKASKTKILQQITDMEDLEQTIEAYRYYVEAVKRDGIPYELISKIIPNIESEVNNILSQITDFTISLEVDGKNINGRMVYDDDRHWPLEMSSGMERFISSLAIRVALITVSNLPKPNFLIIDEGLGVLSSENLMSMHMLFSILKNQFDFIVIISHLEAVRDMVDSLMEIQLHNGFSKINY